MTKNIHQQLRELEALHDNGDYIFRGHESFKYHLIPSAFRPDRIAHMARNYGIDRPVIDEWHKNKKVIETIQNWGRGIQQTTHTLRIISRLQNFCVYLMQLNYSLTRYAKENHSQICEKDRKYILERDQEYWRSEITYNDIFEAYFPRIIEIYSPDGTLLQAANPFEDLTGTDESLPQHYGISTAALDWSYNYLVALYFALGKNTCKDKFLKVYAIKIDNDSHERPIQKTDKNIEIENIRAERQEGTFTYFRQPCSYFLKNGEMPTIDAYERQFKNKTRERSFELKEFTIERSSENINVLSELLRSNNINEERLFPDLIAK